MNEDIDGVPFKEMDAMELQKNSENNLQCLEKNQAIEHKEAAVHMGNGNAPSQNGGFAPPIQMKLWVETKTGDGKSYFYDVLTRETTWTRPDGPNIKIVTQSELEEMNKKQHQQLQHPKDGPVDGGGLGMSQPPPNMMQQPPPSQMNQPPPNVAHQPPPFFQPPGGPPGFGQPPPFGLPPPGFGAPGFPPAGPGPWNMPPGPWMNAQQPSVHDKPAKSLIIKPGVIDPAVIARAAEWSEHRAPDGRPYFYHQGRGESVWEKPQALRDMEAARMAAHGAMPPQQPPAMPPHMMNPLMHMPPVAAAAFDPALAFSAAAAVAMKAAESSKAAAQAEKETKKAAQAAAAAEERRKKEEEQKKAAAAAKPVDKSRPISSTPIAGTPWCVVWTGDARVFFYNPSTRSSVWERPEDLQDREDVTKALNNPPEQLRSVLSSDKKQEDAKKAADVELEKAKAELAEAKEASSEREIDEDEENGVIKIRTESESSVEEIPTKRSKLSTKSSRKHDANEAAVEAEVRAAKERALVPLETRVTQFKDMLREKDVSAFSTWEKELHKIVFDPRYLLLTSRERKQVFERYVKDRAEEERQEKRNKLRKKREDFRKLMEDVKVHGKSSFSDFCQRYGRDERYKAIEKVRERETLFNEFITELRQREKEEKIRRIEETRKDFMEMLKERNDIDRHTRWYDLKKKIEIDPRFRAVELPLHREEFFEDHLRYLKREREKEREKEREREREREREEKERRKRRDRSRSRSRGRDKDKEKESSHRDKDRARDKDKERDKDKTKEKDKENSKDKHKESSKDDINKNESKRIDSEEGENHDDDDTEGKHDDEADRLQKEREKQLRAEQSIREREKEVQRTLAGHLRDRDKEREHHKRDEAIGHLNALLTDLVRNPDLTWKEVKRQLRKDHRWDLCETLDRDFREKIFNDHIDALMKRKREKFREMLEEITTLDLTSSWKDIKKLVKEDPRYLKYSNSDKCEREFRDYIKDKTLQARASLRELLQECKLITHKSFEMVKDNPNHLKEIQDILRNDKRYLVLEHMADERSTIVINFLEELQKRGPPPPPTASESTRRK